MIRFDQRKRMLARREMHRWLAGALMAVSVPASASSWADDGVRELKNPEEMSQVAPMRAVGIRLIPAAPIQTKKSARPLEPPASRRPASTPTTASTPATASLKVSVQTTNLPNAARLVSDSNPRKPERVVPQAPIRLSFSNEQVRSSTIAASSAPTLPPPPHTHNSSGNPSGIPSGSGRATVSVADLSGDRGPLLLAKSTGTVPAIVSPAANLQVEGDRTEANASPIPTASPEAYGLLLPSRSPSRLTPMPVAQLPAPHADLSMASPIATPTTEFEPFPAPTLAPGPELTRDPEPMPEPMQEPMASSAPEFSATPRLANAPTMQLEAPTRAMSDLAPFPKSYSDDALKAAIGVELDSQGTREIQVDVSIAGLTVGDERICRAIASDGRVYLVGGELGETIVEVRSTTSSEPKLLRVKVIAPWQRAAHGVADLDQLRHALRPMCTDSQLSIRAQNDGSIVVQGVVDSKETAKRVLELTRKLTLVPVVDKLEIR